MSTSSPHPPQRILAAAFDAVITIDDSGRVIDLNPAAESAFGCARTQALGRSVADLVIPPSRRAAVELESARRKTLLDHAERLAGAGSWGWNRATDAVLWSDNLYRLLGLEPGELTPSVGALLERIHPDDRDRVARVIDDARRDGEMRAKEMRVVTPDGCVRHLRGTAGSIDPGAGGEGWIIGSVHDVTDQRRAEREIAAHVAVAEALSAWEALDSSARGLLRDLGGALDFTVGALWLPEGDVLLPRVLWSAPGADVLGFEQATRDLRLPLGIGLPGRAWQLRAAVHMPIDEVEPGVRTTAAARDDLVAGIAIPAVDADEVLAVMEFHSRDRTEPTERLLRSLAGVGRELGAFLARRRGELTAARLTPRELQVVQLAADGLSGREIAARLVLSPATVKTHFEHAYDKLGVSDRAAAVAHALRAGLID
jgi:PAS domain S-box-containing protein